MRALFALSNGHLLARFDNDDATDDCKALKRVWVEVPGCDAATPPAPVEAGTVPGASPDGSAPARDDSPPARAEEVLTEGVAMTCLNKACFAANERGDCLNRSDRESNGINAHQEVAVVKGVEVAARVSRQRAMKSASAAASATGDLASSGAELDDAVGCGRGSPFSPGSSVMNEAGASHVDLHVAGW